MVSAEILINKNSSSGGKLSWLLSPTPATNQSEAWAGADQSGGGIRSHLDKL